MRRPTIADLAKAAGVGVATVDRALHGRSNVAAATRRRIAAAAAELGYPVPQSLGGDSAARPSLRLGFVLHKGGQQFYRQFTRQIEMACASRQDVRITPEIRFSPSQSPGDFCSEIEAAAKGCAALATSAVTHNRVAQLSAALMHAGTPVFAVLNDFGRSAHAGYFGLDNLRAGRLAAWMMTQRLHAGGRVVIFVGGNRWHGHALRETGFRSFMREHAPQVSVMDTLVNLETRQVTYEATLDLLGRHPDLRGIYVAGGGMEGALAALRETRPPDRVALIVNELTEDSRTALSDRYALMVVATPLEQLCRALIDRMVAECAQVRGAGAGHGAQVRQPQVILDPLIYLPESF